MKKAIPLIIALIVSAKGAIFAADTAPTTAPTITPVQSQFFEAKIRPIFASACYKCHSAEQGKNKGKLVLDTREGVLAGG